MKTLHVLILAGAILGAGWMLKPLPVEQVSQAELQRRERQERDWQQMLNEEKFQRCAAAAGKSVDAFDPNDSKQAVAFHKCMWPAESRGRIRMLWDKLCGVTLVTRP